MLTKCEGLLGRHFRLKLFLQVCDENLTLRFRIQYCMHPPPPGLLRLMEHKASAWLLLQVAFQVALRNDNLQARYLTVALVAPP